jgi:hypothetical protein
MSDKTKVLVVRASEWQRANRKLFPEGVHYEEVRDLLAEKLGIRPMEVETYNVSDADTDLYITYEGLLCVPKGRAVRVEKMEEGDLADVRLSEKDAFCCLGIHLRECGVRPEEMVTHGEPVDWADYHEVEAKRAIKNGYPWIDFVEGADWGRRFFTHELAQQAMTINDNFGTTDDEKIEALRPIFRSVGWEIDWRPNE